MRDVGAMEGRRIDRYVVGQKLGAGGFGTVFRAKHSVLGTEIALKVLAPQHAEAHEVVQRFLREAKTAAAIGHPHIIQIFDAGTSEDGLPFLAMELLDGEDLEHLLARNGPLSPEVAIEIAIQALQGLGAAHARGIVHRDMKPANIFLLRRPDGLPFVKVLDFGISKFDDPAQRGRLTGTGVTLGTPAYAAPEQIVDTRNVDHTADLFAVAVIVFESITGKLPYAADSFADIMTRVAGAEPARLDAVMPGAPRYLSDVLARAMSTAPAQRFQSADEMIQALAHARQTGPVVPKVPLAHQITPAPFAPAPYTPPPQTGPFGMAAPMAPPASYARPAYAPAAKSSLGLWIGLGVLVLFLPIACIGGGVVVWGLTGRDDPESVAAEPTIVQTSEPITKQAPMPPQMPLPPNAGWIPRPPQAREVPEAPREPTVVPIPPGAPHCSVPVELEIDCDRVWDRHEPAECAASAERELFVFGSYSGAGSAVQVHVVRTAAPIVLAFSAQEDTTWEIHAHEGVRIEEIILHGSSQVRGIENVSLRRGNNVPGAFSFEPWTPTWPERWTGRALTDEVEEESRVPLRAFGGCYNPTRIVIGQRSP